MIKSILTALCLLASLNAYALTVKPVDLHGKWLCGVSYDDISLGTIDATEFNADGTFKSQGIAETPIEKPVLHYRSQARGTWALKADHLVLTLTENKVQRDFSQQVEAMLAQNPQAQAMEQALFEALSSDDEQGNEIDFRLLDFAQDKFNYEQRIGEHKFYGGCKR
ncbi:hypothetical protein HPC38_10190 [Pasteurellaceae bacterium HPA106]|uniref:hypothetical protein n=1 Tax=Spirabiliibacterium pneumoniae TaxID=221400 RepID=UPI001AAD1D47|nr:hypothetical protein [Spirabiliibacterium pneumoniae]MBE2897235.1 hypothetical protein [Spirabiliibacterium pneumoniae]